MLLIFPLYPTTVRNTFAISGLSYPRDPYLDDLGLLKQSTSTPESGCPLYQVSSTISSVYSQFLGHNSALFQAYGFSILRSLGFSCECEREEGEFA